ncbi:MAG: heavy metal-binding domain-containing protein [bacterium]
MKKIKLIVFAAGIAGVSVLVNTSGLLFASSCHGGGTKRSSRPKRAYSQGEIIEIKAPPKMTVKGTLACPGNFLYRNAKGYGHDNEKCKNSAIMVEKFVGCDKSGKVDCPYESKLYHILLNEKSKELVNNKKYRDAKVSVTGHFWPDERVVEVIDFNLLSKEEIKEMESQKKILLSGQEKQSSEKEVIYQCPMHPEVTSDKPGDCPKCGMKLEIVR